MDYRHSAQTAAAAVLNSALSYLAGLPEAKNAADLPSLPTHPRPAACTNIFLQLPALQRSTPQTHPPPLQIRVRRTDPHLFPRRTRCRLRSFTGVSEKLSRQSTLPPSLLSRWRRHCTSGLSWHMGASSCLTTPIVSEMASGRAALWSARSCTAWCPSTSRPSLF